MNLDDGGHSGGALSYTVYGLTARPVVLTDVITSNLFGFIATSDASTGTTLSIALNRSALAAIASSHGANLFIGGIDSGEDNLNPNRTSPNFDFVGDFGSTDETDNTVLHLNTTPVAGTAVPEPNSMLLLGISLGAFGIATRKRRP